MAACKRRWLCATRQRQQMDRPNLRPSDRRERRSANQSHGRGRAQCRSAMVSGGGHGHRIASRGTPLVGDPCLGVVLGGYFCTGWRLEVKYFVRPLYGRERRDLVPRFGAPRARKDERVVGGGGGYPGGGGMSHRHTRNTAWASADLVGTDGHGAREIDAIGRDRRCRDGA
jgi:hypothetical protein